MDKIKSQLDEYGYVFIPAFVPEVETTVLISSLGSIVQVPDFNQKQTLVPKATQNSTPNTYSGHYGLSAFPLHTDFAHWLIPPRFFALRCVIGTATVATHLLDTKKMISLIGRNELRRTLVQPRRTANGRRGIFNLLEVLANQKELFRWDTLFIKPINEFSLVMMNEVSSFLDTEVKKQVHLINQGDTLIVDNWRMLHGRASVTSGATNRKIERVYLEEIFY